MSIKQIKQIITGYTMWIWYYLYKPYREERKAEAKRRIDICESCEYFNDKLRICEICGCFLDVKTKMLLELDENGISVDGCEEKKW
jgi:uncharacterized paraquat-inducible protein A